MEQIRWASRQRRSLQSSLDVPGICPVHHTSPASGWGAKELDLAPGEGRQHGGRDAAHRPYSGGRPMWSEPRTHTTAAPVPSTPTPVLSCKARSSEQPQLQDAGGRHGGQERLALAGSRALRWAPPGHGADRPKEEDQACHLDSPDLSRGRARSPAPGTAMRPPSWRGEARGLSRGTLVRQVPSPGWAMGLLSKDQLLDVRTDA